MGSADCSVHIVVASVSQQSCRMSSADCSVHIVVASVCQQSCGMGSADCSVHIVVASVSYRSCGMGSADYFALLLPLLAISPAGWVLLTVLCTSLLSLSAGSATR